MYTYNIELNCYLFLLLAPTSNRQSAVAHPNDPRPQSPRRDDEIQRLIIELNVKDQRIQELEK